MKYIKHILLIASCIGAVFAVLSGWWEIEAQVEATVKDQIKIELNGRLSTIETKLDVIQRSINKIERKVSK